MCADATTRSASRKARAFYRAQARYILGVANVVASTTRAGCQVFAGVGRAVGRAPSFGFVRRADIIPTFGQRARVVARCHRIRIFRCIGRIKLRRAGIHHLFFVRSSGDLRGACKGEGARENKERDPGMHIGIVQVDGRLVDSRWYGFGSVWNRGPTRRRIRACIASNTPARSARSARYRRDIAACAAKSRFARNIHQRVCDVATAARWTSR